MTEILQCITKYPILVVYVDLMQSKVIDIHRSHVNLIYTVNKVCKIKIEYHELSVKQKLS